MRSNCGLRPFPTVYHAYLASKRADAHINMASTERVRIVKERLMTGRDDKKVAEPLQS